MLQKFDFNFKNQFSVKRVENYNIFFGCYPTCQNDIIQLKHLKIDGILNLMENEEMINFEI
jgi:hypothetical protein